MSEPLVDVERSQGAAPVRLSPYAVELPSRFVGTVDSAELPYLIELTISFDGDRVSCEQLTCRRKDGGMPVTSEGMTHVRVAELVYLVASKAVHETSTFLAPGKPGVKVTHGFEVPPRPVGRTGPNAAHLRALGVLYTIAYACGGSPRRSVMEALGLARTTANRWIRLAREQGYLSTGGDDQEAE